MKYLIYISRIVVGSVFVVSGLIKANDALGFSYKLEEYFEPSALGSFWTIFEPYALSLAILVCVAEVVLGLSLLFGTKYKLTVILTTAFLVFFGFLTYYTAQCDPFETVTYIDKTGTTITENRQCVLDCGCFGDALKGSLGRSLTPWESFQKDMVLLLFTVFLFFGFKNQRLNNERKDKIILFGSLIFTAFFGGYVFGWWMPLSFLAIASFIYILIKWFYVKKGREWIILLMLLIISGIFVSYTLRYLPVKDYRPYAVGNNIPQLMKTSDDFMEEIRTASYEEIIPTYSNLIEQEVTELLAQDTIYNNPMTPDSIKEQIKMNTHQDITSLYEDFIYNMADSIATDSMNRANLFPPTYSTPYYLQHKKTKERGFFKSTVYMEKEMYNDWEFVYILVNKETGEEKEILKSEYNEEEWSEKGFEKKRFDSKIEKEGHTPKIPIDFDFTENPEESDSVKFSKNYTLLVVCWDLEKSKNKAFTKINKLYDYAKEQGYNFYAITSTMNMVDYAISTNNLSFNFMPGDDKILKTIIRSNPGVVLLKNGTIYAKWDKNRIPTPKKFKKFIAKQK